VERKKAEKREKDEKEEATSTAEGRTRHCYEAIADLAWLTDNMQLHAVTGISGILDPVLLCSAPSLNNVERRKTQHTFLSILKLKK
jgi:hypothetical protein